jgi:hypothetical protein
MRIVLLAFILLSSPIALADLPPHFIRGIRVSAPPPPIRVEVPPPAPSARHQWIAGYWAWRGGKQVWLSGHWGVPPAPGYQWEPARWVNEGGSQVFYDGHWRATDEPDPMQAYQPPPPPVQEVVVDAPPPPQPEDIRPPQPFPTATWIPGYWQWSTGRHVWVTGRWSAQPPGFGWHGHQWDHRDDGRWVQRPGHWERHEDRDRHEDHERHEDRDRHEDHRDHDRR